MDVSELKDDIRAVIKTNGTGAITGSNLQGIHLEEVDAWNNGKVDKTQTVNGHALSGNVTVTKGDVGLGNVDNTSDANKPVSTATQTALNAKVSKVSSAVAGNLPELNSDGSIKDSAISASDVATSIADVKSIVEQQQVEPNFEELPLLCGQPMILFGNGTPQGAIVPDNWRQFAEGGYNWNGLPSALGQQYINYAVDTGGRYIAVKDGEYALKWLNC